MNSYIILYDQPPSFGISNCTIMRYSEMFAYRFNIYNVEKECPNKAPCPIFIFKLTINISNEGAKNFIKY